VNSFFVHYFPLQSPLQIAYIVVYYIRTPQDIVANFAFESKYSVKRERMGGRKDEDH